MGSVAKVGNSGIKVVAAVKMRKKMNILKYLSESEYPPMARGEFQCVLCAGGDAVPHQPGGAGQRRPQAEVRGEHRHDLRRQLRQDGERGLVETGSRDCSPHF